MESDEQKLVISYLRLKGMMFAHVPNAAKRRFATAAWLKRQGMIKGMPDILVFDHVPFREDIRGVAIEMKRQKGGKVSDEQKEVMQWLSDCGWLCHVARGADDAISFINSVWF